MSYRFLTLKTEKYVEEDGKQTIQEDILGSVLYVDMLASSAENDEIVDTLDTEPIDNLDIRINSAGGDYWSFIRLYNSLRTIDTEINTEIQSIAAGPAVFLFLEGKERAISKYASICIFDFCNPSNEINTNTIKTRITHKNNQVKKLLKDLINKKYITKDEYNSILDGEEIWLDAEESLKRGIATSII